MSANVTGLDKILRNLNSEIKNIEGVSLRGLILAAAFIRRDMDQTSPLIPIDTGNLRSSWMVAVIPGRIAIQLGFTADYAWYVHEMVGANFQRPGAGAKFFEAALKRNTDQIVSIIAREAGLKKK